MTAAQIGRYSKYIRPISVILDLLVIDFLCLYFFKELRLNTLYYVLYQNFAWFLIAYFVKFYEVYRFTTPVEIISKLVKQGMLFLLIVILTLLSVIQFRDSNLANSRLFFSQY